MKNIIITGSSSGFGLKAAKEFADKGYKVFATMRNPDGKNAGKKAELEGHSAHITVVNMDVTNDASVQQAIGGIIAAEGKVDVLINNAGIMFIGITEAFSVDQAHEQMNANYYSVIRMQLGRRSHLAALLRNLHRHQTRAGRLLASPAL